MDYSAFRRGVAPLAVILSAQVVIGPSAAQRAQVVVAQDTVVRAKLSEKVSTRTAEKGQRVEAMLSSADRSGLPTGTRFEGVVTQAQRPTMEEPGVLDMEFRRVVLPDGRAVAFRGELGSLSEEAVRRDSGGRLTSKKRGEKLNTKWIGYGAGGGAVLATVLGGGFLRGALLGGLGGAIYGYLNKSKGGYTEVDLAADTEFGIRANQRIAFEDSPRFRYASRELGPDEEPLPAPRNAGGVSTGTPAPRSTTSTSGGTAAPRSTTAASGQRGGTTGTAPVRDERAVPQRPVEVRVNGRALSFGELRPFTINGELNVPLAAVARAAGLRFQQRAGDSAFTLVTDRGTASGYAGDNVVLFRGQQDQIELQATPFSIDGEIYVGTEFLSRIAEFEARWDRNTRVLTLESTR
jgi:hypothetical protein